MWHLAMPVKSHTAQVGAMQSSTQIDFERGFTSSRTKMLSSPTVLARAGPTAAENARAMSSSGMFGKAMMERRFRMLPNTKKHVRTVNSSAKWLRGRPEQ